jgi:hypothetical protein
MKLDLLTQIADALWNVLITLAVAGRIGDGDYR